MAAHVAAQADALNGRPLQADVHAKGVADSQVEEVAAV